MNKVKIEKLAVSLASWVGTPTSIVLHTIMFVAIFALHFLGYAFDQIMLILTTLVSLEAIYLSLFIQMTVNQHSESLEDVEEDIGEINENVEDISEDIDDVQEDVEFLESNIKHLHGGDGKKTQASTAKVNQTPENQALWLLQKINQDMMTLTTDIKRLQQDVEVIKAQPMLKGHVQIGK